MRPNLFRMASELKQDEEGMAEILQTNETVTRVMDRYKGIFGEPPATSMSTPSSSTNTATTTTASMTGATNTVPSGATAGSEGATGGATSGAADKQDDVLIDLLDLDLGPPPSSAGGGNLVSGSGTSLGGGSGSGTNLGSLLDDIGSLGKNVLCLLSPLSVVLVHPPHRSTSYWKRYKLCTERSKFTQLRVEVLRSVHVHAYMYVYVPYLRC